MIYALVVEDEEDVRNLLAELLADKGCSVRKAANGSLALRLISKRIPDIIFVDIMMPVMGGMDFISNLRKNPETFRIPVVIVTALKRDEARGRQLGVEYHLTKPWEPWALESVLTRVLGPSVIVANV